MCTYIYIYICIYTYIYIYIYDYGGRARNGGRLVSGRYSGSWFHVVLQYRAIMRDTRLPFRRSFRTPYIHTLHTQIHIYIDTYIYIYIYVYIESFGPPHMLDPCRPTNSTQTYNNHHETQKPNTNHMLIICIYIYIYTFIYLLIYLLLLLLLHLPSATLSQVSPPPPGKMAERSDDVHA